MDTRVAVISIIVENPEAIETLNHLLHEAGQFIIGRMGIPYREKGINIIEYYYESRRIEHSDIIYESRRARII